MNHYTFWGLVKKYFHYLVENYNFTATEYYDPQYENISVGFEAHNVLISFSYDRGDVYIELTNLFDPQKRGHDPGTVVEFLEPSIYNGLKAGGGTKLSEDPVRRVEAELSYWSPLIRQYCEPILTGMFAKWNELNEFEDKSLEEFKEKELPQVIREIRKENSNKTDA